MQRTFPDGCPCWPCSGAVLRFLVYVQERSIGKQVASQGLDLWVGVAFVERSFSYGKESFARSVLPVQRRELTVQSLTCTVYTYSIALQASL